MIRSSRQFIGQQFSTFGITVPVTAIPINSSLGITSLITTIVLSVPTGAANSVFLGADAGVTITSGLEIPPGNPQQYRVINERELVELESPLLDMLTMQICNQGGKGAAQSEVVPFIVWDVSQMYLIATANTAMTVGVFKEMWI